MKKIVCSFVLLAGLLAALCSCDPLNNNDQEKEGTLYGSWKLDTLTIEASASVIGSGAQNTSNIDFTGNSGYLYLSDANMATVKLGWDVEMSSFTFDEKNHPLQQVDGRIGRRESHRAGRYL